MLWGVLQSRHHFFQSSGPLPILADFGLNVGGILLATTLYASAPTLLLALILAPCLLILVSSRSIGARAKRAKPPPNGVRPGRDEDASASKLSDYPVRPFLTAYRGAMMVVTCHAILAVDFRVFPRRFAKVETWGTSVMDMGVGSFVYSAGVVAAKAHLGSGDGKPKAAGHRSFVSSISSALRHALPLFALGVVRLLSVKNLDYAEHVSEYGVHWNFFFTLALLPLALCLLQPILSVLPGPAHGYAGLALAFVYEAVLQNTNLKAWALTAPRDNLLAKNKEGAVSWIGYLAIFLLGMETGAFLLPRFLPTSKSMCMLLERLRLADRIDSRQKSRVQLLAALALSSAIRVALLLPFFYPAVFPALSIPVSRRLANAPYVLWVAAFNSTQILLFALVETLLFPEVHRANTRERERQEVELTMSQVLADFNAGGLLLFLAANLGTGAVNMSVQTLDWPNVPAVVLLIVYMAALAGIARFLKVLQIKI